MAMTDFELLDAWRGGDLDAGNQLISRHFAALYRFFRNKIEGDCDDLLQQTLFACVRSRDRFRGDASFRSYMFQIARNELFHYYKAKSRDLAVKVDLGSRSVEDLGESPSGLVAAHEQQRLLLRALRTIPVDAQILVELSYWEELSQYELAVVFGVSRGAIAGRLRAAHDAIHSALMRISSSPAMAEETSADFERWVASIRHHIQDEHSGR